MQGPQMLSDQQNTSISTKMVWYGLGESQASLLLPSIPAPSRDKNYLSVIVACIPRLHITATHQQLRFDGKYQKRWCVATNKPYSLLCLQSYQVKKSLTSCIFWALQLPGSLQILHIANPDNPETPYMTGKRLRRITALKYLSTIYCTHCKFRSSRGTFAAPATEKGHKYLTKRMATHRSQFERMTA